MICRKEKCKLTKRKLLYTGVYKMEDKICEKQMYVHEMVFVGQLSENNIFPKGSFSKGSESL